MTDSDQAARPTPTQTQTGMTGVTAESPACVIPLDCTLDGKSRSPLVFPSLSPIFFKIMTTMTTMTAHMKPKRGKREAERE
jgi:hypothetical protein